ncbi:MAG: hypothetical protein R3C99_08915 [Pirellulaceae bacterium]
MAGRPFQARSRVVLAGNRMVMALKIGEPGAGSDSEDDRYFNSMSISYQPPSSKRGGLESGDIDETTAEPYSPTDVVTTTNAWSMTPPGMTPPGMTLGRHAASNDIHRQGQAISAAVPRPVPVSRDLGAEASDLQTHRGL